MKRFQLRLEFQDDHEKREGVGEASASCEPDRDEHHWMRLSPATTAATDCTRGPCGTTRRGSAGDRQIPGCRVGRTSADAGGALGEYPEAELWSRKRAGAVPE